MRPPISTHLACVTILLAGFFSNPVIAAPADSLNAQGFRAYSKKDYPGALELFQKAVESDGKHVVARYNLACTMALLRAQNKTCEYSAYVPEIMDQLEAAVKLDGKRKERLATDPDLAAVRHYWRFQKLLGKRISNEADVKELLVLIRWFGPSPGAMGPVAGAAFKADGSFEFWQLNPDNGKRRPRTGTYAVKGNAITFSVAAKGSEKAAVWTGVLDDSGELRIKELDLILTDDRSECSA